jgi:hypothetical protein
MAEQIQNDLIHTLISMHTTLALSFFLLLLSVGGGRGSLVVSDEDLVYFSSSALTFLFDFNFPLLVYCLAQL